MNLGENLVIIMLPLTQELIRLTQHGLEEVIQDPIHQLRAIKRLEIYKLLISAEKFNKIYQIRGILGIKSVKLIMPIWKSLVQTQGKSFSNKDKVLPYDFLKASENLINGAGSIENARKMCASGWYDVGYIHSKVIENNLPEEMYYIPGAAVNLLHEIIGVEFLGKLQSWEQMSNDELAKFSFACDVAGLVENSYIGIEKANNQRRLEFWIWWLTEAIPQAWELAQSSYQDKEKNHE